MKTRVGIILAVAALLLSFAPDAIAQAVTITKEYTYRAGELDSEESMRAVALARVKLLLFEAVAGHVKDVPEAELLAPGLVSVRETGKRRSGSDYTVEASVSIEPGALASELRAVAADPERAAELKALGRRASQALGEMERIRAEGASEERARYEALVMELKAVEASERGYAALAAGSYPAAENYFAEAIGIDPGDAAAHYNRGVARWLLENYDGAVRDFREALKLKPGYARAARSLEQANQYFDRLEDQVKFFDKAISVNPSNADLYAGRGLAHWELGNYDSAVRDFTMVVRLDPFVEDGYVNRGGVYLALEEYASALKDFEAAAKINPESAVAHFNRGLALLKLDRYEEAASSFGRAIEINPSDAEALFNRGAIYAETGRMEKALADMRAAAGLGHRGAREFLAPGVPEAGKAAELVQKEGAEPKRVAPEALAEAQEGEPKHPPPPAIVPSGPAPEAKSEPPRAEATGKPASGPEKTVAEVPITASGKPSLEPEKAPAPEKASAPGRAVVARNGASPAPELEISEPPAASERPEEKTPPKSVAPEAAAHAARVEGEKAEAAPAASSGKAFSIQVGAFSSLENADSLVVKLKKKGYPAYAKTSSRDGRAFYLVLVGRYDDMNKALEVLAGLKEKEKLNAFVVVLR